MENKTQYNNSGKNYVYGKLYVIKSQLSKISFGEKCLIKDRSNKKKNST